MVSKYHFLSGDRIYNRFTHREGVIVANARQKGWRVRYEGDPEDAFTSGDCLLNTRPVIAAPSDAAEALFERLDKPAPSRTLLGGTLHAPESNDNEDAPAARPSAARHHNCPAGFSPHITTRPSRTNPGNTNFVFNFPNGRTEPYGVVGKFSVELVTDRYVKELASRYRISVQPEDVRLPDEPEAVVDESPSQKETPTELPEPEKHPASETNAVVAESVRVGDAQRVLEALAKGANSARTVAAMIVGMSSGTASAWLSQLARKGKIECCGTQLSESGSTMKLWRLVAESDAAAASVVADPVVEISERVTETRETTVTDTRITERTAAISQIITSSIPEVSPAVSPAEATVVESNPASVRPLVSPIHQDGPYLDDILRENLRFFGDLDTTEQDAIRDDACDKLSALVNGMRKWRKAKEVVDLRMAAFWLRWTENNQYNADAALDGADDILIYAMWLEMHAAVMENLT